MLIAIKCPKQAYERDPEVLHLYIMSTAVNFSSIRRSRIFQPCDIKFTQFLEFPQNY
jgi:hypothetical protein